MVALVEAFVAVFMAAVAAVSVVILVAVCVVAVRAERAKLAGEGRRATWRTKRRRTTLLNLVCVVVVGLGGVHFLLVWEFCEGKEWCQPQSQP